MDASVDERTLLEQIAREPNQLAPRQIYADWLLERGDSRGELIAVQCALSECASDDPRRAELHREEARLIAAHAPRWAAGLPMLHPDLLAAHLRRGFLEDPLILADIDRRTFDENRIRLFRLSPVIYLIDELVKQGPRTNLYRAFRYTPAGPSEPAALKMVSRAPSSTAVANTEALLRWEHRLLTVAAHPSFCRSFGLARRFTDGGLALALEWLEGLTLRELFHRLAATERQAPGPQRAAAIGLQLATALDHLHRSLRVLHRELRSDHVMVTRSGEVKLLDLGWAAPLSSAPAALTPPATPGGLYPEDIFGYGRGLYSPGPLNIAESAYRMASVPPEGLDGAGEEGWDVFQLGLLACELVLGSGRMQRTDLERRAHDEVFLHGTAPVGALLADIRGAMSGDRDIPRPLLDLILRALAVEPRARPSCAEITRALEALMAAQHWEVAPERLGHYISSAMRLRVPAGRGLGPRLEPEPAEELGEDDPTPVFTAEGRRHT